MKEEQSPPLVRLHSDAFDELARQRYQATKAALTDAKQIWSVFHTGAAGMERARAALAAVVLAILLSAPQDARAEIDPPGVGLIEWIKLAIGALVVLAGGAVGGYQFARQRSLDSRSERRLDRIESAEQALAATYARQMEAMQQTVNVLTERVRFLEAQVNRLRELTIKLHDENFGLRRKLAAAMGEAPPLDLGPSTTIGGGK